MGTARPTVFPGGEAGCLARMQPVVLRA